MTNSKLEANGRLLGEMSITDHLEALRWTLVRVFTALGVFIIGGFAFVPWIFKHVVMAPIDNGFFLYRWLAKASSMLKMVPDDANERRNMRFTFVFGTVMFFIGCMVGYSVVFPLTLRFLYNYQLSADISNQLSLDSYMDNFLMLVFMMGIIFELPLVSMFLGKVGLLNRSFFREYRRHAIVALLVVSAFITPSSDPFTLMAVFIPIYILWELSAFLVRPARKDISDD